jgi:hypothetical protein
LTLSIVLVVNKLMRSDNLLSDWKLASKP